MKRFATSRVSRRVGSWALASIVQSYRGDPKPLPANPKAHDFIDVRRRNVDEPGARVLRPAVLLFHAMFLCVVVQRAAASGDGWGWILWSIVGAIWIHALVFRWKVIVDNAPMPENPFRSVSNLIRPAGHHTRVERFAPSIACCVSLCSTPNMAMSSRRARAPW